MLTASNSPENKSQRIKRPSINGSVILILPNFILKTCLLWACQKVLLTAQMNDFIFVCQQRSSHTPDGPLTIKKLVLNVGI